MISFAYPWVAAALPLPIAIHLLAPPFRQARAGVRVPFLTHLAMLAGSAPGKTAPIGRRSLPATFLLTMCWLLALAAVARPQWIETPVHKDMPARDLLLLVDLSGSMGTTDFTNAAGAKVDRLTAVKEVLDGFLRRRSGDRVGLVVFGNTPFTLVPFTTDLDLGRQLLAEMQVGMAGPRTVFGDAIGLGINLFEKSGAPAKTIIALTDGNDTASRVPPDQAARIAKDRGIVIHSVAIGDPAASGEEKLDEEALRNVASLTGGSFFRALDRESLAAIYAKLDAMEARKVETVTFRPRRDLFWVPLALLIILSMGFSALRLVRWPGRPREAQA